MSDINDAPTYVYRPATGLVATLSILFALFTMIEVGGLWIQMKELGLLNRIDAGYEATDADFAFTDAAFMALGGGSILIHLLCAVFFCIWIYRANCNARALGGSPSISPGWSAGWFFVPLANLYKPCQAMQSIWLESAPRHSGAGGENEAADPVTGGTALVVTWWAAWIAASLLGRISTRMNLRAETFEAYQFAAKVTLMSSAAAIVAALLAMAVVRRLHGRQQALAQPHCGDPAGIPAAVSAGPATSNPAMPSDRTFGLEPDSLPKR